MIQAHSIFIYEILSQLQTSQLDREAHYLCAWHDSPTTDHFGEII